MKNKLWLVKRTDYVGYDEYDAFVICAETKEKAKEMSFPTWAEKHINIELIGEAAAFVLPGRVLGSFNAG